MPANRQPYPSDLTDEQWHAVAPLLGGSGAGDVPDAREVVNAILYATTTGCKWSRLPHEFPPWGVVHSYYRRWRNDGTWEQVQAALARATVAEADHATSVQERPRPGPGPLSPVHRLRVYRMCPYLGSRSNGMTRRAYPSTQNVCRAEPGRRRKVDRDTQDTLCLGENHQQCAYYRARAEQDARDAPTDETVVQKTEPGL